MWIMETGLLAFPQLGTPISAVASWAGCSEIEETVVRGGYGIAYDRVNTVQSVIIPMLGVGFAQTINLQTALSAM